jgi:membrane associated rhomboid family serine protease
MYVSRGVPSRAASAARGAVGGAIVGALYLWVNHDDGDFDSDTQAAWVGAAGGGVVGLVGGALFPRERWHRVRIPRGVSVAPAAGGGAALGFSIAR